MCSRTPPPYACHCCTVTPTSEVSPASGKSGVLNVILGTLTACPDVVIWGIDLKGGMELGPWAACLDRLATTPREAAALLADATAIPDARATEQAQRGNRLWAPSPDAPALIIVIDEYAREHSRPCPTR